MCCTFLPVAELWVGTLVVCLMMKMVFRWMSALSEESRAELGFLLPMELTKGAEKRGDRPREGFLFMTHVRIEHQFAATARAWDFIVSLAKRS